MSNSVTEDLLCDIDRLGERILDASTAREAWELHLQVIGTLIGIIMLETTTEPALSGLYARVNEHRDCVYRLKAEPDIPAISPIRNG